VLGGLFSWRLDIFDILHMVQSNVSERFRICVMPRRSSLKVANKKITAWKQTCAEKLVGFAPFP
jgi:hypothetical protein